METLDALYIKTLLCGCLLLIAVSSSQEMLKSQPRWKRRRSEPSNVTFSRILKLMDIFVTHRKKFMQELLGKELASMSKIRFGYDRNAKECECEDPLPLFINIASQSKVVTAYCSSYL